MNKVADVLMGIVIVAAIFVLVRPRSQGPGLVEAFGRAFSGSLRAATGGGQW